jgi:hypothetical protein
MATGPHDPFLNRRTGGAIAGSLAGAVIGGEVFGQLGFIPGLVGSMGTSLLGSYAGSALANKTYHSNGGNYGGPQQPGQWQHQPQPQPYMQQPYDPWGGQPATVQPQVPYGYGDPYGGAYAAPHPYGGHPAPYGLSPY